LLDNLDKGCDRFRASLYANDATIFIKTTAREVAVVEHILEMFAQASGLVTNLSKTKFFPIRCEEINLQFLTHNNRHMASFPCIYLGLPLHFKRPFRAMLHPVVSDLGSVVGLVSAICCCRVACRRVPEPVWWG
jgi:hypothetical protein